MGIIKRKSRVRKLNAQNSLTYTGVNGEITYDTENHDFRLHDGVTPGGLLLNISDFLTEKEIINMLKNDIDLVENKINPETISLMLPTGEYGWVDLMSDIEVKGAGTNTPEWEIFKNNIHSYSFRNNRMTECWSNFHINHDYALGTNVYPHIHWSPNTISTGTVRWGFEYTVAKGHPQNQGSVFAPTSIVYVEQTISTDSQYVHFVTETNDQKSIPFTDLEPDTLILMRIFRDGKHPNDTFPDPVFGFKVNLHYKTARFSTTNKTPNFYGA